MIKDGYVSIQSSKAHWADTFINVFTDMSISKEKFDFIELSFLNKNFTLLPKEEFNLDTVENFIGLHNPLGSLVSLRYNPILTHNLVVAFDYSEVIEFYFEKKYPFVKIIHNSARVLPKIDSKQTAIHLVVYPDEFELVRIEKEVLHIYNIYNWDKFEDILYHIRLQNNNSMVNNIPIIVYEQSKYREDLVKYLKDKLPNHSINPSINSKNFALVN